MQKKYTKPEFKLEIVIQEDSLSNNSPILPTSTQEVEVAKQRQVDNPKSKKIEW